MSQWYAVVDIGAKTTKLVIFEVSSSNLIKEVKKWKKPLHLQSYITIKNEMSLEGQHVLVEALQTFKLLLNDFEIEQYICGATAALRDIQNQEEVLSRVKHTVGWNISVLTGEEEAYYGYAAVVQTLEVNCGITCDIGGGSTEITSFYNNDLVHKASIPVGTLVLAEQLHMVDGLPLEDSVKQVYQLIEGHMAGLPWVENQKVSLIGIGGSAHALAKIDRHRRKLPRQNMHGYRMAVENILQMKTYFSSLSNTERKRVKGLSKEKADNILPALYILETLIHHMKATQFVISRNGWREGILYDKLMLL
ncbi:Ppx/GppA phosphatase family protein [Alteribacillus iranensis]|uniref:Exopolyphosphatase / guanosine-5'-triphosphate,3'-diphosphate pyrophosphatase n=1 Tax=Alteribacillus iranensis TaxID=930128 RepID=A0A1I2AJP0_9BACI|nr:hypothetical protein [Alteribacillus iranensis]SFE43070.1 exopolyphosphatase / guanosine-5'-triphosphate,3'-diphosphate pyrophosphatase [Alteribacillus iranensis]